MLLIIARMNTIASKEPDYKILSQWIINIQNPEKWCIIILAVD